MKKVKVLDCFKDKNFYRVILESSPFYVDGKGGQLGDRGSIQGTKILEVPEENSVIVNHELPPGEYFYFIDEERRLDIAIQHTAQHLFSAIAYNDYELNTVGFRMADNYSTVDLDSKELSLHTIEELENKVNDFISKGSHVLINIIPKNEANNLSALRKKISDKVQNDVRIIEIEGIDTSACGGFHVENIKDLRVFKIIKYEKIKGSYTRFYFIAGNRAIADYSNKTNITNSLIDKFSCKSFEILSMADKLLEEKKKLETELRLLAQDCGTMILEKLLEYPIQWGDKKILFYSGDYRVANYISQNVNTNNYIFIGTWENGGLVTSKAISCGDFVKYLNVLDENLKGGGNSERGNLKGNIDKTFILCALENFLKL